MFSAIRSRITYVNVVATLVLVFAMTGGALAAKKYLITSTKQISPSVLKSLQGKAGAAGSAGAAGVAGAQGAAGPAGAVGPAGAKGDTGAAGKEGPQGKEGATGKQGATGAKGTTGFTETLPSGKTETGVWGIGFSSTSKIAANYFPISFTLPLETAPTAIFVGPTEESKPGCPGRGGKPHPGVPMAEPGKLCVYAGALEVGTFKEFVTFEYNEEFGEWGYQVGTSPAGTLVDINCPETECNAQGSWAVTAE